MPAAPPWPSGGMPGSTAVRLLAAIDAAFPAIAGERTTWTTGRIKLDPGAPSIIPGSAEILFQFRDVDGRAGAAGSLPPRLIRKATAASAARPRWRRCAGPSPRPATRR